MPQQQQDQALVGYLEEAELDHWRDIVAEGHAIGAGGHTNYDYDKHHDHWERQFKFVGYLMEHMGFDSTYPWNISVYDGAVRVSKPPEEESDG